MKPIANIVEAEFVAGVTTVESLPPPALAEIAFAGRSNVGKSSLLNALMGRRNLVRVGKTPGTTRQVNFFQARANDGLQLMLVDLPGYGFAKRGKAERAGWGTLVETYLTERVTLRAVVLLVDVRRGLESEEEALVDFIRASRSTRRPPEIVLVATKVDKVAASQRKPTVTKVGTSVGARVIGFSALNGEGRDDLWRKLQAIIVGPVPAEPAKEPSE
jgi:GTP-binding protein